MNVYETERSRGASFATTTEAAMAALYRDQFMVKHLKAELVRLQEQLYEAEDRVRHSVRFLEARDENRAK